MIVTGRNEDEDITMMNLETETETENENDAVVVMMMKNLMVTGTENAIDDIDDTATKKMTARDEGIGTGMKRPMRIVKKGEGGVGIGTGMRGTVGRVGTSQRS